MVRDKSTLVGLTTFNIAGTECDVEPDCALILKAWLLTGVLKAVLSVRVDVLALASVMSMEAGLKAPTAPNGRALVLRFTWPVNPASGVTVTI